MTPKIVSQVFKILFQTGDINIFPFCGAFSCEYVQLNSCFSNEKISVVKSETHLSREAIEH